MQVTRAVVRASSLIAKVSTASLQVNARLEENAGLEVQETRAKLSVVWVDPTTTVSHVLAASNIEYILLDVTAELDIRGLFPVVRDTVDVQDATATAVGKNESDAIEVSDASLTAFEKVLSNTVFTGEVITIEFRIGRFFDELVSTLDDSNFTLGVAKEDAVNLDEVVAFLLTKGFADTYKVEDVPSLGIEKPVADTVTTAALPAGWNDYALNQIALNTSIGGDFIAFGVDKGILDSVSGSDDLARVVQFIRGFTDEATQTDDTSFGVGKALADSQSATDAASFDFAKTLTDSLSLADVCAIAAIYLRDFEDFASALDSAAFSVGKALSDSLSASDQADLVVDYSRLFTESAAISDAFQSVDFGKQLSDSTGAVDTFSSATNYSRDYADAATVNDSSSLSFGQGLSDSLSMSDQFNVVMNYALLLSDTQSIADNTTAVLPIARSYADQVTVNTYLSLLNEGPLNRWTVGGKDGGETFSVALDRGVILSDSTTVSDSGNLVNQDFVNGDFFAQDYVGTGGTF